MKEIDVSVCYVPGCENDPHGQLVFVAAKFGTGQRSWFSGILLCESHAEAFDSDEHGVLSSYVDSPLG